VKRLAPIVNTPLGNHREFVAKLTKWFRSAARPLPWRQTSDPYKIWLSEVMLQQTTVPTVLGYYDRFLVRFPTLQDLARAQEIDVLRLWAGLGYYRRARMLLAAAKEILRKYGGEFPATAEELRALPGVGRYTANAIACFAFNQRVPIVEANTGRVLSRLCGLEGKRSASQAELWHLAEALLPPKNCKEYNYALMELGSLVCTKQRPKCPLCPVSKYCAAFAGAKGATVQAGQPKQRVVKQLEWKIYVCCRQSSGTLFLVRKMTSAEWHAGLYGFPYVEFGRRAAGEDAANSIGGKLQMAGRFRFSITNHRISAEVWLANVENFDEVRSLVGSIDSSCEWVDFDCLVALPLASPYRRALELCTPLLLSGESRWREKS
jgi:A/G-specific adenine glycosylase